MSNLVTGSKASLFIHRQGWTNRNAHKVEGKITDKDGVLRYEVFGTWNRELSVRDVETGQSEVVFRVCPLVPDFKR